MVRKYTQRAYLKSGKYTLDDINKLHFEDLFEIYIICPYCQAKGSIELPESFFKMCEKPLLTIMINSNICNHSFQIFVDRNKTVRGYGKNDFNLTS